MLTLSTPIAIDWRRTWRKNGRYHHGDLERALVETAVQMIQEEGVQALTLRGVGARLGVSRTALYRHFDDKQALLARVASEGFRRFHDALAAAVARAEASAGAIRCRRWPRPIALRPRQPVALPDDVQRRAD